MRELARIGEPVGALVRKPDAVVPGAEPVVGDLNDPAGVPFEGVTGVFLLSGYADMPGLLARARAAGVERVVLLSGGSAALADLDNAVSRYMTLSERPCGSPVWRGRPCGRGRSCRTRCGGCRSCGRAGGGEVRVQYPDVPAACVDPGDIAAVAVRALRGGHEGRIYD
ncbi:SDR family oxidoreductase [Amycolatopsis methanolica]|uniref:SDR family oxidoreductase n=1 Tax=Amycolatopsis methanolica TaxID=1814 RepID=UPI0034122770